MPRLGLKRPPSPICFRFEDIGPMGKNPRCRFVQGNLMAMEITVTISHKWFYSGWYTPLSVPILISL